MLDDLDNCIGSLYDMLKISYGALITPRGSKIYVLYILDGFTIISNISFSSQDFNNTIKLWHLKLVHISKRGLVELSKQSFLGSEKLNKLKICDNLYGENNTKWDLGVLYIILETAWVCSLCFLGLGKDENSHGWFLFYHTD